MIALSRLFLCLFFLFLPFQVCVLFYDQSVYFSGFFNPYLSNYIYLSDFFFAFCILFLGFSIFFGKANFCFVFGNFWMALFLFLFVILLGISVAFSFDFYASLFYFLRFVQFYFLYFLISSGFLHTKKIFSYFVFGVFLSALIGIGQYITQGSLGLFFLGEPLISFDSLTSAKFVFDDRQLLRSYGTFPHPNLFSAYLGFALLLIFFLKQKKSLFVILLTFCLGVAFVLTFSRISFLALFLAFFICFLFIFRSKFYRFLFYSLASLIIIFILFEPFRERMLGLEFYNLFERILYFDVAGNMIAENLFGVGISQFTFYMQDYTAYKLLPWLYQPVHNLFILIFAELGIFGFLSILVLFCFALFYLVSKRRCLNFPLLLGLWIFVFVVSLFDHYFLTLYQGQALLFIFFALVKV